MYDQERVKPKNIFYKQEIHKNLLPIELEGFRVHMKLNQDQEVPRVPKLIKEGLMKKPSSVTINFDLPLPAKLQDKVMYFQMHLKSIHLMYCLAPSLDGTQINIVGGRFNMELDEEVDRLKKDYAGKKRYLIETDLGYTPECDISRLRSSKKGRKLLM